MPKWERKVIILDNIRSQVIAKSVELLHFGFVEFSADFFLMLAIASLEKGDVQCNICKKSVSGGILTP